MSRSILWTGLLGGLGALAVVAAVEPWSEASDNERAFRLSVVWSSADPGVAKNVCFMYTLTEVPLTIPRFSLRGPPRTDAHGTKGWGRGGGMSIGCGAFVGQTWRRGENTCRRCR